MNDQRETEAATLASEDGAAANEAHEKRVEDLPPAARRALAEATARREALDAAERERSREVGGRGGKDPARYGDWEVKGIAVDF